MKRSKKPAHGVGVSVSNNNGIVLKTVIEWEVRPGGMLVQKRDAVDLSSGSGPSINIIVSHSSSRRHISVPAQSTFGDLKRVLAKETGLEPNEQRLLFGGKEKEEHECLHMAGVRDMSKVVLLEDPASRERKLEEMKKDCNLLKAYEAVANVRAEVDKLANKVAELETSVHGSKKVTDKEFVVLSELLMVQLLKLDSIEANGEAKVQRRIEVRRIQSLVETVDNLKARNSSPFSNGTGAVAVTTKWEKFESGVGSLRAPVKSSTTITQDWEMFD